MTTLAEFLDWTRNYPIRALILVGTSTYIGKYLLIASNYNHDATPCLIFPLTCILYLPYIVTFCYGILVIFKYRNVVLFPSVIVVFLVAFQLPMPPLPKGEDAKHFFEHRAQYEFIVEQVKYGNMDALDTYPDLFRNIYSGTANSQVVVFLANTGSHAVVIVYADKEAHLEGTQVCDEDGAIYDQLDDHWWVCHSDWL